MSRGCRSRGQGNQWIQTRREIVLAQNIADRAHLSPSLYRCVGQLVSVAAISAENTRSSNHCVVTRSGHLSEPQLAFLECILVTLIEDRLFEREVWILFLDLPNPRMMAHMVGGCTAARLKAGSPMRRTRSPSPVASMK